MIKSNWPIKNLIMSLGLILSKFVQKSFNLILNLHCLSSFGYNRVQLGLQFVQNCSLIFQYVWNPSLTSFSHVASLLSIIILFWKEKDEFREEFINRLWQWWWEGRRGGWRERKKNAWSLIRNNSHITSTIRLRKKRERRKGEKEKKRMVFNSKQFAYNIYDLVKYASFPNIFFNYVTLLISFPATSYA